MSETVLDIRDLRVSYQDGSTAVDGLSLSVAHGEIVALVGESGSGKSTAALAVLGLLPAGTAVSGSITLTGQNVLDAGAEQLRTLRGPAAGMVFQEPMTALNPLRTVGFQLAEAIRNHDPARLRHKRYHPRCVELLERVGVPEPAVRLRQYPHQLSGGLRQRVMIAIALAARPQLIIADEPTTALDVTVQQQILDLLRDIREKEGTATLLITHNMGVVADVADRVLVLRSGNLVEEAPATELFSTPQAEYTRELLAAVPQLGSFTHEPLPEEPARPVLALSEVVVEYDRRRAVDQVSLNVAPGEIVGLVGESGSGKTTLGNCALGLVTPKSGTVEVLGGPLPRGTGRTAREVRRRIGAVFQDPASSLDPRMTVAQTVAEPLIVHTSAGRGERRRKVRELLDAVELPEAMLRRYGHELSGGQRQRVSLARALVLGPELLIADEPTSALDVSVQAAVLEVFRRLHTEFGFGCLFVSHDLAVVDSLCDRVAVLRSGEMVEHGPADVVLRTPEHPYTRALLLSSPVPDPRLQRDRRAALSTSDPAG
ncbi:dipeptide ABC transporter ATP-binding protein [Amycolatopsis jiangsuensis]|uniref:Peptide/nickel transport system ATP-binding protein n=1 Tax=Amycolatopsis jiangsuensis TaxID=1181879 RepID=A0A840J548_9PSEU|nr:ABC transporter ATP-binding protein [Amycolatopsis jiangsuensis]MBB4688943.1 peptide/nickel transport system ATP-binding protein [Amycolatopsis jiangsuensis]